MMVSLLSLLFASQLAFATCPDHSSADGAGAAAKPARLASAKLVKGAVPEKKEAKSYGQGITLTNEPISLSEALARKEEFGGREVLVRAEVAQVCLAKGCWITLKDKDKTVRVTFKDYSFFVPKDSAKRMATVQGKLFDKELSAAEARHYAKDAGDKAEEIRKIQHPSKEPWLEATGLTLIGN